MKKNEVLYILAVGLLGVVSAFAANEDEKRIAMAKKSQEISMNFPTEGFEFKIAKGPFQPKEDGFAEHYECPDWFRDAKFGIYSHWGLCTVPGYDGHYARFMYHQETPQAFKDDKTTKRRFMSGYKPGRESVYEYHVKNFGHPSVFGYKEFIPMWKAEKFDAMKLTAFFKEVGAKYFGVMAVHHDNFDNYDSTYNEWNSVKMGPKKDIVGEWKAACETYGLRFGITSHLSNHHHEHRFYQGEADAKGPLKGVPYDTMNPANDSLYGYRTPDRLKRINPRFAQSWYLRTKDLIDKYDPDMLYLDGGIPNGDYGFNLAAHFYNQSILRNKGKLEGVFAIKRSYPEGFTLDREMHAGNAIEKKPWQTDTSINPGWFYMGGQMDSSNKKHSAIDDAGMGGGIANKTGDVLRLSAGMVVDNLIDIVSKNGNMLLNVGLRADGSLPETYRDELVKIGAWLKVNGDGIYGTRPYKIFGEGPFAMPKTGHKYNDHKLVYTSEDLRFTTKGNTLYTFMMTWPENNQVLIKSLSTDKIAGQKIASVSLLGSSETLKFEQTEEGLLVMLPKTPPSEYAHGLKIDGLKFGTAFGASDAPDLLEDLPNRLEYRGYALNEPEFHIWGCSPVMDEEGKVHLFVARWSNTHNHHAWKSHCEIAHYVGDGPEGPFKFSDVVVQGDGEGWATRAPHNPCIKKIDDKYVLTYIANSGRPFPGSQCIGMQIADSLYGPWKKVGENGKVLAPSTDPESWTYNSHCGVNNPAFIKSKDGRYFLYFKSQKLKQQPKKMGVAIADKLEGPYIIQENPVTNNDRIIEDATAFIYNDHYFLLTTDNHGIFLRGGGVLWRSKDGLIFDHCEPGFLLMDKHLPKELFVKPRFLKGNSFKFERPQILSIEGKPSYLYMPSQCNLAGDKVSTSFILKIKPKQEKEDK